jgi:hypothetical protein
LRKAQIDVQQALRFAPPAHDSAAAIYFYDVAKVYTAVAYADPKNPDESLLEEAENRLFKAVELGLLPELIQQRLRLDRYKLLEPLLKRESVQKFLEQHDKKQKQMSP